MPKQSSTRSATKQRRREPRPKAAAPCAESVNKIACVGDMPKDYSELARLLVLASWPAIVQGLIRKAVAGGYQQAKLLLDLCALTQVDASNLNDERKQHLCDALLQGLTFTRSEAINENAGSEDTQRTGQ